MNKPSINIQDGFLFQSLKDGRSMGIELVTGKAGLGAFMQGVCGPKRDIAQSPGEAKRCCLQ